MRNLCNYFQTVCPLQMETLAMINKDFVLSPSGFKYYGDLQFHQTSHLPCKQNLIDTRYNGTLFNYTTTKNGNMVDLFLGNYFMREGKEL